MPGLRSITDKLRNHKAALELLVHDEHSRVILDEQRAAEVFEVIFD